MIIKDRLVELTRDLIRINSENPTGNEAMIADFVGRRLRDAGLKVRTYEFKDKRVNIVSRLNGRLKKTVLISPHLDTVPAGSNWKYGAFKARIFNGKIYGRGASDCKCNLAIAIEALASLKEDNIKPGCDVLLAATADEEAGSKYGLIPLLKRKIINPDYAVILDSEELNIITTQKGLMHFKVSVPGKSAHGAYPGRGINAIELSSAIILDLKRYKFKYTKNPLLKGPTVNIGTICGGEKVNMVADFCSFSVDLRYLPGMKKRPIINAISKIVKKHSRGARIEFSDMQEPYSISKSHPLVKNFIGALKKEKIASKIKGSEGATVITFFQDRNIPAISFGCSSSGCAHSTNEYVKTDNLLKGARVLERFLKNFGGA